MHYCIIKVKFCLVLGRWTLDFILFFKMKNCCILESQWQSVTNSKTVIVTTKVSNKNSGAYFDFRSQWIFIVGDFCSNGMPVF